MNNTINDDKMYIILEQVILFYTCHAKICLNN